MLQSLKSDVVPFLKGLREQGISVSLDTGFDPKNEWKDNILEVLQQVRRSFYFAGAYAYLQHAGLGVSSE